MLDRKKLFYLLFIVPAYDVHVAVNMHSNISALIYIYIYILFCLVTKVKHLYFTSFNLI